MSSRPPVGVRVPIWKQNILVLLAGWFWISRNFNIPHPPVGLYIGVLAFMGGVVTIWPAENPWAKAGWFIVFGGFLVLEISTVYKQRAEDQTTADTNRRIQDEKFRAVLTQNQNDFDATMHGMESVLNKQDRALLETMGGAAYPLFIAAFPEVSSPNGIVRPIKVINTVNTVGRPQKPLPLVDVSVDLSIGLRNGNYQEVANSLLHSPHYNLGTILPGIFETAIQLQPGKSYNLIITTRRSLIRETLNLISQQKESWCMYQRINRGNVSEERLVGRSDGKPLTELCD
jgi:hypothetical protein